MPPLPPRPSPPWGRGWTATGAFTSRRGPGLRPPKGYGRSGQTARYGPQAGEGVPADLLVVDNNAGQDASLHREASNPGAVNYKRKGGGDPAPAGSPPRRVFPCRYQKRGAYIQDNVCATREEWLE